MNDPVSPSIAPDSTEQATERAKPPLSATDCDVLYSVHAIATWLGMTYDQARPLVDDGTIPTFSLPGHSIRCGLKSTIHDAFRQYANRPGAAMKAIRKAQPAEPAAHANAA